MTDRELMQMVLEALTSNSMKAPERSKIIKALRDRLAQPEPEPVAYLWKGELFFPYEYQAIAEEGDDVEPLFRGVSRG